MEAIDIEPQQAKHTILIVDDNQDFIKLLSHSLGKSNYKILTGSNGQEALDIVAKVKPNLIVSDVMMPYVDGLTFLKEIRSNPDNEMIPVIMLTSSGDKKDILKCFEMGADDFQAKPIDIDILKARIQAKLKRLPIPVSQLTYNYHTSLLTREAFFQELKREIIRAEKRKSNAKLVCVKFYELEQVSQSFGVGYEMLLKQVSDVIRMSSSPIQTTGHDSDGRLLLLLPEMSPEEAYEWLRYLGRTITNHNFSIGTENVRLTPIIGFTPIKKYENAEILYEQALIALQHAAGQLDLEPFRYQPSLARLEDLHQKPQPKQQARLLQFLKKQYTNIFQTVLTLIVGLLVPFAIYVLLGDFGYILANIIYLIVIVALLVTAGLIWVEGVLAQKKTDLPEPGEAYPPASAIIAAYLPNEAATVVSTIEAFLRIEYDAPLQIILAYNTPKNLPVEDTLREIAKKHPNFHPIKIEGSTSKAQNVNAALSQVTGTFVGVFDADHQPDPDSYKRAWCWLSNGYDIVQGHCLVRNGQASGVARTIAVEFESIYGMSHPGRARMHNFGIFGGSNGYWRSDLLREIRMHGFMLTEDIDSSIRSVIEGRKIKSDPELISRELAPTSLKALWNQRMRWAQGWFQVSKKQAFSAFRSDNLSVRQKLGIFHLLVWRELYPWLSLQIIPIIFYWAYVAGGFDRIDWFVPIFIVTTIITTSSGPLTLYFAYRVAEPSIKRERRWFWRYLVLSLAYTEYKNQIARLAQIKEFMGERVWHTTPRA